MHHFLAPLHKLRAWLLLIGQLSAWLLLIGQLRAWLLLINKTPCMATSDWLTSCMAATQRLVPTGLPIFFALGDPGAPATHLGLDREERQRSLAG